MIAPLVRTAIGFDAVLAQGHNVLTIAPAQTLNLIENDFFPPSSPGSPWPAYDWAGRRGGPDPAEMDGMVMFAFGLACLAGPIGFYGILATMLWVLVAGIWMVRQGPPAAERATLVAGEHVTV